MTTSQRNHLKEDIVGYGKLVKQRLEQGWQGQLMTLMFNKLTGGINQMNLQMQHQVENLYASFLTRLYRRPHAYGVVQPILIACPDFPVPKYEKQSLPEVITN